MDDTVLRVPPICDSSAEKKMSSATRNVNDVHIYEKRSEIVEILLNKKSKATKDDVSNKFQLAFVRSDSDFLSAAVKRRASRKYATLWKKKGNTCEAAKRKNLYFKQCRRLNIIPSRRLLSQIGGPYVSARNFSLARKDLKALCRAITGDSAIKTLDISGNLLSAREVQYLQKALPVTRNLNTLALEDCHISSAALQDLSRFLGRCSIKHLSLRGNSISDRDHGAISLIINTLENLQHFNVSHNNFEGDGCRGIAKALESNTTIKELDMSWNHIRQRGSIAMAKCLQNNTVLTEVNFAWNGFAYEGCAALSDALRHNTSLTQLDISCNRIHPPAMLELSKGLCKNKCLCILDLSQNPITPIFTSVFLDSIRKSPEMALRQLKMENIIVDKAFVEILTDIKEKRTFEATYEMALPVRGVTEEKMRREVEPPSVFNVDPLRLLYMLKEKNRARDFFRRINKDDDESVSPEELRLLFKESGVPVSGMVIEKIIDFMDTDKDGKIDLGEFLEGDRRIRRMSREVAKSSQQNMLADDHDYTKYSRSFRKGHIDPMTYRLKVSDGQNPLSPLSPIQSREPSPAVSTPRRMSVF